MFALPDLLFPRFCLVCKKPELYICGQCAGKVRYAMPICPMCGGYSCNGITHAKCKTPESLNSLTSIWVYEGVLRKAFINLKYKFVTSLIEEIAGNMIIQLNNKMPKKEYVLIPIPTTRRKKNWRGFNQTEEIGRKVASSMGWKYVPDLLFKRKNTKAQTELKRERRLTNLKGAYNINTKYKLQNLNILLFDDIWTTGTTMKEAAKVLKQEGFKCVFGLTIAQSRS